MISLPVKYFNDIGSRINFIDTLVVVKGIRIATRTLKLQRADSVLQDFYVDRDLTVSNIKQSVDFEKRAFKINNVSIKISNFKIDGSRFSDLFINQSLVNSKVEIYHMTKTATSLSDCLLVFTGKAKRYTIDENTVNLSIEDVSQEKLHKDLPLSRLPERETILEKYRNKLIPSVFGYNDKSPLVYYKESLEENRFYWIPDNVMGLDDREAVKIGGFALGWESQSVPTAQFNTNLESPVTFYFNDLGSLDPFRRERPLRAWKDDWIEVATERRTFKTDVPQYSIDGNRQYIQMERDGASKEILDSKAEVEGLSASERKVAHLLHLSSTTNNIFEGISVKKPTSLQLLDERLNASESIYSYTIIHKGIDGGNGYSDEIVELEHQSDDPDDIYFTFPKPTEYTTAPERRGITIPTRKQGDGHYVGQSNVGMDAYLCSSSGSSYWVYQFARNNGCYITQMPTPQQIRQFMSTWRIARGLSYADIGVTTSQGGVYSGSHFPNASSSQWRWDSYEGESGSPLSGWVQTWGGGRLQYYGLTGSGEFRLNLRNNHYFNEWWLGLADDGSYGSDSGTGPIIKEWSHESHGTGTPYTNTWYHSVTFDVMAQNSGHSYNTVLSATEFYKMGDLEVGHGDWYSENGGGLAYFNPNNGCFNTGTDWSGSSGVGILTYGRHQGLSSRGYNVVDDADLVSIVKQASIQENVKINFNFPDLDTNDVLSPIYSKDDPEELLVKSYRPQFHIDVAVSGKTVSTVAGTYLQVSIDNFQDYLYEELTSTANVPFAFLVSDSPYNDFDGMPNQTSVWDNPNDYNDIGVAFKLPASDSGQREYQLQGVVKNPVLTHYVNYQNLEKTKFYGRVFGRYQDWTFSENVNNYIDAYYNGGSESYNPNTLLDYESDDWYIYPKQGLTLTAGYHNIYEAENTGNILWTDFVGERIHILDAFASLLLESEELGESTVLGSDNYLIWQSDDGGVLSVMLRMITEDYTASGGYTDPIEYLKYKLDWTSDYVINTSTSHPDYANDKPEFFMKEFVRWNRIIQNWWNRSNHTIENPVAIICSILKDDLGFQGSLESLSIGKALSIHLGWKFGFTVDKTINSKKLIEQIASNTRVFPKIRPTDGSLSFVTMLPNYLPEDIDIVVDPKDIIKYSFSLSKIDKVKNKVRVLYKFDPETREFDRSTEYVLAKNLFTEYSSDYYGLESETDDTTLDFESHYIRDEWTANQLRNYLCSYHCNQKLIINIDLPISYSYLETGDVFHIENLVNDFKAYGMDYSTYSSVNGQIRFPYFMIQDIAIKKTITIKAEQLMYTGTDQPQFDTYLENLGFDLDDIDEIVESNVSQNQEVYSNEVFGCTYSDADNYDPSATTDNGTCTFTQQPNLVPGDVNGDGFVNILDIVAIVNSIVGE